MNPDQRLALKNACDQLTFRKQVYEDWNYIQKYPYGRGLSVLLFGAPGTGKSLSLIHIFPMSYGIYRYLYYPKRLSRSLMEGFSLSDDGLFFSEDAQDKQ